MHAPARQAKRAPRWGLQAKLIASMLLVGLVPLLIGLFMAFYQGTEEIRQVSGTSFEGLATETARKLDLVLSEEVSKTARIARNRLIVAELERRRDSDISEEDRATTTSKLNDAWDAKDPLIVEAVTQGQLAELLRRYYIGPTDELAQPTPVVTRSATAALFITDITGVVVASLNTEVPYTNAQEPWWQGAFHKGVGRPYIGNVALDNRLGIYTFTLSLPIMDSIGYQAVGVLHRIYDAKEFFAPSIFPIRFGKTGQVMLIDSLGTVVTCPVLPTGTRLADAEVISLVTQPQAGWVNVPSDGHGGQRASIIGAAPLSATGRVTRDSTGLSWHTFVWQSSAELFAPVDHLLTWISVFGLVAVGLLATLGYLAAGRIITPIRRLQEAALLIGRGELKEPITIKTGDEIEDLADEINRMHAQLEVAFAGLTDQVRQKTQEVESLQKSTDQILDSVPTPILILDEAARVHYTNQAAREAFALGDRQEQATSLFDLLPLDERTQKLIRSELEYLTHPEAGSATPSSERRSLPRDAELRDPLDQRRDPTGSSERKEVQIGQHMYRYEWFPISGRATDEQQIGLALRNATEESQKQDQLIQAEKRGSISVLVAGIGHELNNPLFGIMGLGEAIQEEKDLNTVKSYAHDIVQHGKRMASIIRDFTGLARADVKDRLRPVDLNKEIERALTQVPHLDEHSSLEVRRDFQPLPPVTALPEDLCHLFVIVMTNSVQAMGDNGTLTVSSQASNGTIRIQIHDTGAGIPKAYLPKVFDPFFTTKKQGQGAGLGLTVASRIATKHGGRIQIESEERKGTTCLITFPVPEPSHEEGRR